MLILRLCFTPGLVAADTTSGATTAGVLLASPMSQGIIPVQSWKRLRDDQVVKQSLDDSCGAASLATLLNAFYGQTLTEAELLEAMDVGDGYVSFADMARALPHFGFRAQGFATSWAQLVRLKTPVIVHLRLRSNDHFAVLRGIDHDTVWLADPSLGNRTYSRAQFLDMWSTRSDAADGLVGKLLIVLPYDTAIQATSAYFSKMPDRQSVNAVAQLTLHFMR